MMSELLAQTEGMLGRPVCREQNVWDEARIAEFWANGVQTFYVWSFVFYPGRFRAT